MFDCLDFDDAIYIKIGIFDQDHYKKEMDKFLATATKAKTKKLDLRSNGGGDDTFKQWMELFLGHKMNSFESYSCPTDATRKDTYYNQYSQYGEEQIYVTESKNTSFKT